jgi:putative transposase
MRNKQEVDRRVRILGFWEEHGTKATRDAFTVSERTLFRWHAALAKKQGHLDALDPQSTAPKEVRKRNILPEVETFIIEQRTAHPCLGKKKLTVFLKEDGYKVSESYTGRVIHDLKERKLLPQHKKLSFNARTGRHHERQPIPHKKLRRKQKSGMELDTIIRFIDGIKRYILTAIDVERKFAFAGAYTSHSSASAADFLRKVIEVCPFVIDELQTDNGSEFAKHFEIACTTLGLTHFNTHVRSPKENAFIERFNRTISEDFIMLNRPLLRDNVSAFNEKLVDWLIWYNTKRPHESLGMVSPLRYIVSTLTAEDCQRYWTRTHA